MKRITIIIFLIMILATSAYADNFDLGIMTDEELLALSDQVIQEILTRGIAGKVLYEGFYLVPVDIPAGAYLIKANAEDTISSFMVFNGINSSILLAVHSL